MAKQNSTSETAAAKTTDAPVAGDAAKAKQFKIPAHVMYLGPTFTRNSVRLSHQQIFNNSVPAAWLEWIASEPEFRLLFVEVGKAPARTCITKYGWTAYRRIREILWKATNKPIWGGKNDAK